MNNKASQQNNQYHDVGQDQDYNDDECMNINKTPNARTGQAFQEGGGVLVIDYEIGSNANSFNIDRQLGVPRRETVYKRRSERAMRVNQSSLLSRRAAGKLVRDRRGQTSSARLNGASIHASFRRCFIVVRFSAHRGVMLDTCSLSLS